MEEKQQLVRLISEAQNILIVSHENPDRDAIGSILAMGYVCKKFGKDNVQMANETPHDIKSDFVKYLKDIAIGDLSDHIKNSDLLVIVDTNEWRRVSKKVNPSMLKDKKIVIIDHHDSEMRVPDVTMYIKKVWPSTCELIYEIFNTEIGDDVDVLKPIFMGMYADTLGFTTPNVKVDTLKRFVNIIEKTDLSINEIARESDAITKKLFEAGKIMLNNANFEGDFFSSYISREDADNLELNYVELSTAKDSFLPLIMNIEGIEWGLFIKPTPEKKCSVSFRSNSTKNMIEIASMFGGGGHFNASGCMIDVSDPVEALKIIISKINHV